MHDDQPWSDTRRRQDVTSARAHPELIVGELALPPVRLSAMQPVRPAARRKTRRVLWLFIAAGAVIAIALMWRDPPARHSAFAAAHRTCTPRAALVNLAPQQWMPASPTNPRLLGDATTYLRQARRTCLRGLQQACAEYRAVTLGLRFAELTLRCPLIATSRRADT
jgi:hypothetical protein